MFEQILKPTIADPVIVMSASNHELTRFTAVWKRPDRQSRKALSNWYFDLVDERKKLVDLLGQDSQKGWENLRTFDDNSDSDYAFMLGTWLDSLQDLQTLTGESIEWKPELLPQIFEWDEIYAALVGSFVRLILGTTLDDSARGNSSVLESTGHPAVNPA